MIKKTLLAFLFLLGLFVVKGVFASDSYAATVSGYLDNRRGAIAVQVSVKYMDQAGAIQSAPAAYTVSAGGILNITSASYTTSNFPSISWSTACDLGSSGNIPSSGAGVYYFDYIDVHCTNINSSVAFASITCVGNQGTVNWKVQNIGANGANIGKFKVYKSLTDPDLDTSPVTVDYTAGTTDYPATIPSLLSGVYNVKLVSYTASLDSNNPVINGSLVCGSDISPPGNLVANVSCVGGTDIRVDFTWNPAGPGTFDYLVETSAAATAPAPDGNWVGPSQIPSPSTLSYTFKQALPPTDFSFNQHYWWHVKAVKTPAVPGLPPYYSVNGEFTTPNTCAGSWSAAVINGPAQSCASTTDNLDFDVNNDNYANANKDLYKFMWSAASDNAADILEEKLEISTDYAFSNSATTVYPGPFTSPTGNSIGGQRLRIVNIVLISKGFWRVSTKMTNGNWYVSKVGDVFNVSNCIINVGTPPPPPALLGSAFCRNGITEFNLRWTGSANSQWNIMSRQSGIMPLPGFVAITSTYAFSWNGTNGGLGSTFDFYVSSAIGGSNIVTLSNYQYCSGTLVPPDNLSVVASCDVSKDINIVFRYHDTNYTTPASGIEYRLEVSSEPFTGPYSTNPSSKWGYRTNLSSNGGYVTWNWYKTYVDGSKGDLSVVGGGNANPQTVDTADDKMPIDGVSYFWRMKAVRYNATNGLLSQESAYVYPDGSTIGTQYPSGIATTAQVCKPRYNLAATFVPNSWKNSSGVESQSFIGSENVSVDIKVENVAGPYITASYPTKLYFYYKGSIGTGDEQLPNCTTLTKINPPHDGVSAIKEVAIGSIPAGGFQIYNVPFNVGATAGSFTSHAYVVPACAFTGDTSGGVETDWSNNKTPTGFTYSVNFSTFFETQEGDVGAGVGRTISVGVDSSALATPKYQSKYLLSAGSVGANAKVAPGGFRISSYPTKIVPGGGVYNYLANRYRNKATQNGCNGSSAIVSGNYNAGNKLYYCSGDAYINTDLTVTGNPVFFIDGDLHIRTGNVIASGANSAVFVVKGDIISYYDPVASRINLVLDGIYVARKSFKDVNPEGTPRLISTSPIWQLTVNGGVYADGEDGGNVQLTRYFPSQVTNSGVPTDVFKFDPKYLAILSNILAEPSVGWKEVGP